MTFSTIGHTQNKQDEKEGLADWIRTCWKTKGNKEDTLILVNKAFQYFDEHLPRLQIISTLQTSLHNAISDYVNQTFDKNHNAIFDTEYKIFDALCSFNREAHQLATFQWQEDLYTGFKKSIKNEIKCMGNFTQKIVSNNAKFRIPVSGVVPKIFDDWNNSSYKLEKENREKLFVGSLFAHLWNLKCQENSQEIYQELRDFSNQMETLRKEKGSSFGFVVDTSLIDNFKNPYLRIFISYIKELKKIGNETQKDIEESLKNPPPDNPNFENNLFDYLQDILSEKKQNGIDTKTPNQIFFEKNAPLYNSGHFD